MPHHDPSLPFTEDEAARWERFWALSDGPANDAAKWGRRMEIYAKRAKITGEKRKALYAHLTKFHREAPKHVPSPGNNGFRYFYPEPKNFWSWAESLDKWDFPPWARAWDKWLMGLFR